LSWFEIEPDADTRLAYLTEELNFRVIDLDGTPNGSAYEWHFSDDTAINLIPGARIPLYRTVTDAIDIRVYDPSSGTWIAHTLTPASETSDSDFVAETWTGSASPDGTRLAWASGIDQPLTISLFDLATDQTVPLTVLETEGEEVTVSVAALAWAPDASALAVGLSDGRLLAVDVESGAIRYQVRPFELQLNGFAWSPDGAVIALAGSDGDSNGGIQFVRLVRASNGVVIREFELDFGRTVQALAFSPDGSLLVSGDSAGSVQVWEVATGERLADLRGHTLAVTGIAFSPDGTAFATSSRDGTVRVWGIP
jgi:WD40 repeat protein